MKTKNWYDRNIGMNCRNIYILKHWGFRCQFTGHILLFRLLLKPCSIIAGHTLDLAVTHFTFSFTLGIQTHQSSFTFFAEIIVCHHRLTLELTHKIYFPFWVKKPWIIDLRHQACKLIFPNLRYHPSVRTRGEDLSLR